MYNILYTVVLYMCMLSVRVVWESECVWKSLRGPEKGRFLPCGLKAFSPHNRRPVAFAVPSGGVSVELLAEYRTAPGSRFMSGALGSHLYLCSARLLSTRRDGLVVAGGLPLLCALRGLVADARPALHSAMHPCWSSRGWLPQRREERRRLLKRRRTLTPQVVRKSLGGERYNAASIGSQRASIAASNWPAAAGFLVWGGRLATLFSSASETVLFRIPKNLCSRWLLILFLVKS